MHLAGAQLGGRHDQQNSGEKARYEFGRGCHPTKTRVSRDIRSGGDGNHRHL